VLQLDEEELLEHHLESAKGTLKSVYDALNRQHHSRQLTSSKVLSSELLSELGSGQKKSSGSISKKDMSSEELGSIPPASDSRVRPSRLLTHVSFHLCTAYLEGLDNTKTGHTLNTLCCLAATPGRVHCEQCDQAHVPTRSSPGAWRVLLYALSRCCSNE
jgi:hypothetical protein